MIEELDTKSYVTQSKLVCTSEVTSEKSMSLMKSRYRLPTLDFHYAAGEQPGFQALLLAWQAVQSMAALKKILAKDEEVVKRTDHYQLPPQ